MAPQITAPKETNMDKTKWLRRINILLFFLLLYQAITGLLVAVIDEEVFEIIHPVGGGLLFIFGLIHLSLNWGWVRSVYFTKKSG